MEELGPAFSTAIPLLVVGIVLIVQLRRGHRARPLNLVRMWLVPGLFTLVVMSALTGRPPTPLGWIVFASGMAVGAMIGWQRGRLMQVSIDPVTGKPMVAHSAAAIIFLVAIIALRTGVKAWLGSIDQMAGGVKTPHLLLVLDASLGLALATIICQRIEMFLRARRLSGQSFVKVVPSPEAEN